MNVKSFLLGFVAYPVIVFPLAYSWHLILFKTTYESLGYLTKEPNFALALLSMFFQAAVLSYLYPKVSFRGGWLKRGFKFGAFFGVFFWSCHVIATAAKHAIVPLDTFIMIESVYMALQFLIYGCVLALIYEITNKNNKVI
jgi:hypothetical protein